MRCFDIGKLRAFCDGELAASEAARVESHIARCVACKEQFDEVRQAGFFVAARLNAIAPLSAEAPPGLEASLMALRRREPRLAASLTGQSLSTQGDSTAGWLFALLAGATYRWRTTVASLAAVVIVISLIAFPPVRTVANDLLGIFRVQKFTQVTLDPASLSSLPMLDPAKMGAFDGVASAPKAYSPSSPAEAAAKLDFPLRLPQQFPGGAVAEPRLTLVDSFGFGYTFDLAKATAYLESMGIRGIALPKTLGGQRISATLPVHVVAQYGPTAAAPALALYQGRSPAVEVPDGVNMEEVFDAVWSTPGLPPELVVQLRAIDWKTTVPVPVLKGDTSLQLIVDGVEGLLVRNDLSQMTVLLWQKEGVVYVMAGQAPDAELIAAANSLK